MVGKKFRLIKGLRYGMRLLVFVARILHSKNIY